MTELKLLIQGYAKMTKTGYRASPATVLLRDSGKTILVDPGSNKERLLAALRRAEVWPGELDYIFLTHFHLDHILNIRLFPHTAILDVDTIYRDDGGVLYKKFIPDTKIKVIPTPGHAHEHGSLLVKTAKGNVVVAGDVWWWEDGETQRIDYQSLLNKKDPFVKNWKELVASREKLLKLADWITPGHGPEFKFEK